METWEIILLLIIVLALIAIFLNAAKKEGETDFKEKQIERYEKNHEEAQKYGKE